MITDELGFVPFERARDELLFNLLSERHERRSALVATNSSFFDRVDVLGDVKLRRALPDRLAHRAHVLTVTGPLYQIRWRDSTMEP